jgi:hypothetical protein
VITRRDWLARGVAAAAAWPLVGGGRIVQAAASGPPLRLVLFPMLNGCAPQFFWPTLPNLSMVTEPLRPYTKQLTFVRGVDIEGSYNHMAIRAMFTGAPIADYLSPDPAVKSVDQVVADRVAATAPTPLRSLHLGVIPADSIELYQRYGRSTFYFDPQPVDYEANPVKAFDRTFKGASAALPPGMPAAAKPASFDAEVLDIAEAELKDLLARVGNTASEKAKLLQHQAALRGLRPQAGPTGPMTMPAGLACDATPLPSVEKLRAALQNNDAAAYQHKNYSDVFDAQIDIMARALVCGLTRVATIQANSADGNVTVPVDKGYPHHMTSHTDQALFARLQTWYAGKMLRLLKALDVPDPLDAGGKTVLYNTLILWMSECMPANHDSMSIPVTLLGNAGGALKGGVLVDAQGATNKTLLQTIVQIFGVSAGAAPQFGGQTIAGLRG